MSPIPIAMPSQFDRLFVASGLPILIQQFGVWAAYTPKTGPDRSPRDILVICKYDRPAAEETETSESVKEWLWVATYRDVMRGIDAPELGDSLLRAELDPPDSPWSFQGVIRNESTHAWELLYARIRPRRYGPSK